jgi:hypothetical protein
VIWLTWRQFRANAVVTAAFLAAFTVLLVVTGVQVANLAASTGFAACHGNCVTLAGNFITAANAGIDSKLFYAGLVVMYAAPALIGIFWGAPLITRELESGTFRLAWNQSVTRNRWLAVKLGLIGLAAMTTAGLLSLMTGWWASPVERALAIGGTSGNLGGLSRLQPLVFSASGIAPVGYAAFAFALGVTAGVFIRRTVPAMVVTLAGFAFVQLAWPAWIRPHLIAPDTATLPLNTANLNQLTIQSPGATMTVVGPWTQHGAWVLSNQTITPAGHVFTGPATQACLGPNANNCTSWLAGQHLRQLVTYQPASRYWAFQWTEAGIFLVLALALAALCAWRISRRRQA